MTELSRREFLERAGGIAALVPMPAIVLSLDRLLQQEALPVVIEPDLTRDTLNGLAAFVLPGDDPYSRAQGQTFPGPGGVASGGVTVILESLDRLIPVSVAGTNSVDVPASSLLAVLLNNFAIQVDPLAAQGVFASPFARLSWEDKAEVMARVEDDETLSAVVEAIRYVGSLLLSLVAFVCFSEGGVYDPRRRALRSRPLGWEISHWEGPADGRDGFRGYYRGRRAATATPAPI